MSNPYNVAVGQVWKDNDPRLVRHIEVLEVDAIFARVKCRESGRKTNISLSRFRANRANGFTQVLEP